MKFKNDSERLMWPTFYATTLRFPKTQPRHARNYLKCCFRIAAGCYANLSSDHLRAFFYNFFFRKPGVYPLSVFGMCSSAHVSCSRMNGSLLRAIIFPSYTTVPKKLRHSRCGVRQSLQKVKTKAVQNLIFSRS